MITLLPCSNKPEQSKLATYWAFLQPSFLHSGTTSWSCGNNGRTNPKFALLLAEEVWLAGMFVTKKLWKFSAPIAVQLGWLYLVCCNHGKLVGVLD